jgi:ribosomal protein L21E
MSAFYIISSNNKLFATSTDYNSMVIVSTNITKMKKLMKMMRYYHGKDGRVMNCYQTMYTVSANKSDRLELSSYASEEINESIESMHMVYINLLDMKEFGKLKMCNSKVFHMTEFDYSLTEDILTINGIYLDLSRSPMSETSKIKYLDRMFYDTTD